MQRLLQRLLRVIEAVGRSARLKGCHLLLKARHFGLEDRAVRFDGRLDLWPVSAKG